MLQFLSRTTLKEFRENLKQLNFRPNLSKEAAYVGAAFAEIEILKGADGGDDSLVCETSSADSKDSSKNAVPPEKKKLERQKSTGPVKKRKIVEVSEEEEEEY